MEDLKVYYNRGGAFRYEKDNPCEVTGVTTQVLSLNNVLQRYHKPYSLNIREVNARDAIISTKTN